MTTTRYVYVIGVGPRDEASEPVAAWSTLAEAKASVVHNWRVRPAHSGGATWLAFVHEGRTRVVIRRLRVQSGAAA